MKEIIQPTDVICIYCGKQCKLVTIIGKKIDENYIQCSSCHKIQPKEQIK